MSGTATVIAVGYAGLAALSLVLAAAVWRSTRSRRAVDAARLAKRENASLAAVVAILVALLLGTIFLVPYGESAPAGSQHVSVTGFQFAWLIEPQVVKANVPVEFELTSSDVSHAFAVYDEDGVLLTQVQVVPGRTQKLVYTFEEPGTYDVLCLEFCGFAHDVMRGTIEVRA